jgi:16S rRNA (cytidine1402-2'-O)-methyltransferase
VGRGTLYVVATPLGHLGDLTARATELLRSVPVVAAEDTRRSRALLTHIGALHPRLISYHAHSDAGAAAGILRLLAEGSDVALVTDAGTPGISDPGSALVHQIREAGFLVVPIPGPSAVSTALSAGGLPADRYLFMGFLPRKGTERSRLLARIATEEWTTVLFEAPGRVGGLLEDLRAAAGDARRVVVARELTKLHEEFVTGTLAEMAVRLGEETAWRGECTVLLEGAGAAPEPGVTREARAAAARLLQAGITRKEVAVLLGEWFGLPRNEAYRVAVDGGEGG